MGGGKKSVFSHANTNCSLARADGTKGGGGHKLANQPPRGSWFLLHPPRKRRRRRRRRRRREGFKLNKSGGGCVRMAGLFFPTQQGKNPSSPCLF